MSERNPTSYERQQLKFDCDVCDQKPGEWCLTFKGSKTASLHVGRPASRHQTLGSSRPSTRMHFAHPEETVPACMVAKIAVLRDEVCSASRERSEVTCDECKAFLLWEDELSAIVWLVKYDAPITYRNSEGTRAREQVQEIARKIISAGYRKGTDDE